MNTQTLENQIEKELDQGVIDLAPASYEGLDIGDPESSGYMCGPRFAYETDDRKWEFTASSMLLGSYTTDVESEVSVSATFPIIGPTTMGLPISTSLDIEYKDIDLRAKRNLNKNWGLFAGYIYQSYTSELEADYSFTFNSMTMSSSLSFKLDAFMHMLYGGFSYTRPVGETFTFNGNFGCGTPVAGKVEQDLTLSGSYLTGGDITNDGGEVKMAFMGFGEISMAMKVKEKVKLELGYQYRRLTVKVEKLDLDADGNADESTDETDVFHGVTFAATYLINL